jgi:hypothetical protein
MGLKIADLLKWRSQIVLKDHEGKIITDDKNQPVTVFLRIIGDDDLDASYKAGRIASARLRKALRDPSSDEYLERIDPIKVEEDRDSLIDIIKTSRGSNITSEARSAIDRPELPKIEEFAVDPDAPTLEEQEKLDAAIEESESGYLQAIGKYEADRMLVIEAELKDKSIEELRDIATEEASNIIALSEFLSEILDQKVWRGCYTDKARKERAFDSIQEWRSTDAAIREQLIEAYIKLEQDPDELKN